MKICVLLRDKATTNLRSGNLRSEPRWERQVLEACVESPLVEEVYTAEWEWEGGQAVSPKYKGLISGGSAADTILIMQDWHFGIAKRYKYKGIVVNIYAGPWEENRPEIASLVAEYGNRLVFTSGFPVVYRRCVSEGESDLRRFVAGENVRLLPVPGIPVASYKNCFENKTILWSRRCPLFESAEKDPGLVWALEKLKENSDLDLHIIFGWRNKEEERDLDNGEVVCIPGDLSTYFWSKETFKSYIDLRPRVRIDRGLNWENVLEAYNQTKVLANHAEHYGGPPLEAAMYGVPFIGTCNTEGALADCPGYLYTVDVKEAYSLLDTLLVDEVFYRETALSYHNYAAERYTYEAFCLNLFNILKERNLV